MNTQNDHTNPTTALALIVATLILGAPQLANTPTTTTPATICPTTETTTI